jgi:predicted  nucleic acid-binding Zn-ribbon protein
MDKEMEKKIREQIHEIVDIILDTNGFEGRQRSKTGTMPSVFADYSGHVNQLSVRIYEDGWAAGSHETRVESYLDRDLSGFIERLRSMCRTALTEKKESDILRRDIAAAEESLADQKRSLSAMKRSLKKAEKKEAALAG